MPNIDAFGNGMTVVIDCQATGKDNFMTFASWYSFFKNLPDAKVVIACQRPIMVEKDVFAWVRRIHVPFFYYRKKPDVPFSISPNVLCLDSFDEETLKKINEENVLERYTLSAKSKDRAIFCSIKDGCGLFVPDRWIHTVGHPFGKVDLFSKGEMTINEKKVFELWKKMCPLYDVISWN